LKKQTKKMQVITATECFGQKKEKIIKREFAILYGRKQSIAIEERT